MARSMPLREIRTADIASALSISFPDKNYLSDNGQQLISKALSEVMEMMGIERRLFTPYHAQSNGIVERFNDTPKNILPKLTANKQQKLGTSSYPQCYSNFGKFLIQQKVTRHLRSCMADKQEDQQIILPIFAQA